jgi:hypothetical protein
MLTISRAFSVILVLTLLGCATRGKKQDGQGIIVTPGGLAAGTVISVNANARFAVLRFPIAQLPPVDQRMSAYRQGLKVADLRITGPQRDFHTVADIVAGECRVGDDVRGE